VAFAGVLTDFANRQVGKRRRRETERDRERKKKGKKKEDGTNSYSGSLLSLHPVYYTIYLIPKRPGISGKASYSLETCWSRYFSCATTTSTENCAFHLLKRYTFLRFAANVTSHTETRKHTRPRLKRTCLTQEFSLVSISLFSAGVFLICFLTIFCIIHQRPL